MSSFFIQTRIKLRENLLELEYFKFESTHQDDNFIITDAMDIVAQQEMMEQLYEQSKKLIAQVSHPTYDITADAVNFLFIEKLAPFINTIYDPSKPETLKQLLGVKFNLEVEEDEWIEPVLLKFHINFDDPTDFSLEFSNRYRLNDSLWTYADLMGEAVSTSGNLSFDYSSIKEWSSHRNDLVEFANNSLDMTKNNLVNNSDDQTFLIDHTGLRGHSETNGVATGRGIWLTADTLAFSDDNFNTVRTAIGLIPTENGANNYGVNAEVLIGKMIFGSELTIANENNTMKMDGDGLVVETNTNRILLNPDEGILIQKKSGNSYVNQMYADDEGNLVLAGGITATDGYIGGFEISENSIKSPNGNIVLNSDGTATIGDLSIRNGSANFNGTIYADQISVRNNEYLNAGVIGAGTITGSKLVDSTITATQIAGSTITASEIAGGTITSNKLNVSNIAASGSTFRQSFDSIYATELYVDNLVASQAQINWLKGSPQYNNGYYEVKVNGGLQTTQWLEADTNISAGGWLSVEGNATIGGTLTTTGTASIGGNLRLYTDSTWRTVKISGSKGYVPTNANILYVEL